jgi:N-acetylglucosamine-6-phosphate deacetylase
MNDGFVDIQVNGYGGVNYNIDGLTAEQLHTSCLKLEADGVAGVLATFISDDLDTMVARIKTFVRLRAADPLAQKIVWGIHIEGPFMSAEVGYRGAHPVASMKPIEMKYIEKFYDACEGLLRIFTLSPEQDPGSKATAWLSGRKVTVAGGHSNATFDQLKAAADAGLSMWTHLGNGCPAQMHRHDNIIQRVLSLSDKIWICFIGDGVHVPLWVLKNYLKASNLQRTVIVSDAVWPAGMGPGKFDMGPRWGEVIVGEDLAIWAPDRSHFLGSASTMRNCYKNLASLGYSESQLADLLIHNPARFARPA